MKLSIERLAHFLCDSCGKWFTIGDPPSGRTDWYCPWCGTHQEITQTLDPNGPLHQPGKACE